MAADGTIRFDTSLDPEGFQQGSETLKRKVQSLLTTTNKIGRSVQTAFTSFVPTIQTVSRAFEDTNAVMRGTDFAKYMTDAQGQVARLASDINRVGQAINSGFKDQHGIDVMQEKLEQTSEQMQMIEQRMQELSSIRVETESYSNLAKQFAQADAQLQKLQDREANLKDSGVSTKSAQYEKLQQQIQMTEQTIQNLKKAMEDMESEGTATISGSQTQEYEQLSATLDIVRNSYDITQEAINRSNSSMAASANASAIASNALHGLVSGLSVVATATHSAISALARLGASVAKVPFQALAAGARGAASAFRMIGSAIRNAISHFAAFRKQGKGVGDLASELVGRLDSVKRMLVSRVKRMFISAIMKDMQAAMSALAQKSSEFQSALNGMQTAASGLSANLASLFGGIITALAPVVTQIISWISTIISYINALFALLSGKGTIMTAKKGIDSLGSSAGGGSKKVKELKKELMGFDEINNLKDDEDSGGGGGSGGAGDLFEETSIDDYLPENIRDYFQRIRDAILSENWEEVGRIVADGLNYALLKIDEAILRFQSFGVKWANIIARVMNGVVEKFNFPLLGKTIADGFMTIIRIENEFLKTFEFTALGAGLGQAVNAMFEEIEWTEVGDNFALKIMAINDTLNHFLTEFDGTAAGADLGQMVNAMFDGITWTGPGGIADTFSSGITSVLDVIDGFIAELQNGKSARQQEIADAIYEAFTGKNWVVRAIGTLNEGFKLIASWFSVAFESLTKAIKDLAPNVVDEINRIIREEDFSDVEEAIIRGVNNLIDAFDDLTRIDFDTIASKIKDSINNLISETNFEKAVEAVGTGAVKIFNAFLLNFSKIRFDTLGKKIAKGINSIFTNEDLDWKEIGKNLGESLRSAVKGMTAFLTELDLKDIGTAIGQFLSGLPWAEIAGDMWEAFKVAIKDAWNLTDAIIDSAMGIDKAPIEWKLGHALDDTVNSVYMDKVKQYKTGWFKEGNQAARSLYEGLAQGTSQGAQFTTTQLQQSMYLVTEGYSNELNKLNTGLYEKAKLTLLQAFNANNVDELKGVLSGAGIEITSGFAEALGSQGLNDVEAAIKMLCLGINESAIENIGLTGLAEALQTYMNESGLTFEEAAIAMGSTVGSELASAVTEAEAGALESGKEQIQTAADETAAIVSNIDNKDDIQNKSNESAGAAVTGAETALTEGQEGLGTTAQGTADTITDKFDGMPDDVKANTELMMQAISLAIDEGKAGAEEATQTAADAVVDKAADIMSSAKGEEIASTFVGGITGGIQGAAGDMYGQMAVVGSYITAGMAHGIYSTTNVVKQAAINAAIAAYNAAMRALDAHSPSKLFAQVGKFTMLGWAKGEEDNQSAVIDTIANTAKAMEEEAKDTEFNVSADALVSGLDIAMDRLQSIADVFSSICDMIANIGELPIPAIATGSVIPYRTRISDGFTDNETSLPSNVLTVDNGYDVMYRAFRSALLDTADDRPIELSINGKKLADWVQKQNRIDSRSRGV